MAIARNLSGEAFRDGVDRGPAVVPTTVVTQTLLMSTRTWLPRSWLSRLLVVCWISFFTAVAVGCGSDDGGASVTDVSDGFDDTVELDTAAVDTALTEPDADADSAEPADVEPSDSGAPGDTAVATLEFCTATAMKPTLTVPYATMAGVEPNLLSVDLYRPELAEDCPAGPLVVFVHGGGWRKGDKADNIVNFATLVTRAGMTLASVNYRLSPSELSTDPDRVKFPDHPDDVGRAIGWLLDRAAANGVDPTRVALVGFSAGAHLSALVTTNPSFLEAAGYGIDDVRAVVSLDTATFDLPTELSDVDNDPEETSLKLNAFGSDPDDWVLASPQLMLNPEDDSPNFLLLVRGGAQRHARVQAFADVVTAGDDSATVHSLGETMTHSEARMVLGAPEDDVVTPPIMAFLRSTLMAN